MKKWIALALSLVLALSLLTACGKDDNKDNNAVPAATQAAPGTPAATVESSSGDLEVVESLPATDGDIDEIYSYPATDGDME